MNQVKSVRVFDRIVHSKAGVIFLLCLFLMAYLFVGSVLAASLGSITASFAFDVILMGLAYWYLHVYKNRYMTTFGRVSKLSKNLAILYFTLSAITIYFICQLAGETASHTFGDPNMIANAKAMRANPQLSVLMSLVIAPLSEEMIFRGMVYNTLKSAYKPLTALIIQALVFAILHGTWGQGVGTLLLALFNGMLYEYSGKIRYPIYVHLGYNFFAVLYVYIMWPKWVFNIYSLGAIYFVIIALVIAVFIKISKLPKRARNSCDPLRDVLTIK